MNTVVSLVLHESTQCLYGNPGKLYREGAPLTRKRPAECPDMSVSATFRTGETIALAVNSDSPTQDVSDVAAAIKRAVNENNLPGPNEPVAATFTITARAAAGDAPAGWDLRLDGGLTTQGIYATDFRYRIGTEQYVLGPLVFSVTDSITPRIA